MKLFGVEETESAEEFARGLLDAYGDIGWSSDDEIKHNEHVASLVAQRDARVAEGPLLKLRDHIVAVRAELRKLDTDEAEAMYRAHSTTMLKIAELLTALESKDG